MNRRTVAAVRADQYNRVSLAAEILQITRDEQHRTRDVMRKRAQEQIRLTAIHRHQLREFEVRRELHLVLSRSDTLDQSTATTGTAGPVF